MEKIDKRIIKRSIKEFLLSPTLLFSIEITSFLRFMFKPDRDRKQVFTCDGSPMYYPKMIQALAQAWQDHFGQTASNQIFCHLLEVLDIICRYERHNSFWMFISAESGPANMESYPDAVMGAVTYAGDRAVFKTADGFGLIYPIKVDIPSPQFRKYMYHMAPVKGNLTEERLKASEQAILAILKMNADGAFWPTKVGPAIRSAEFNGSAMPLVESAMQQ